jgi:hypothetical protein
MTAAIEVAIQSIDLSLLHIDHNLYTNMISHHDASFHLGLGYPLPIKLVYFTPENFSFIHELNTFTPKI